MAAIQIPNLPPAIALNGAELLEAVQAGSSVRITSSQIANLALVSPNVSTPTTYQFMSALAATGGIDANLLWQALPSNFESAATIQFYCSPFVPVGSALYNLCVTTYPGIDMVALYTNALLQPAWG